MFVRVIQHAHEFVSSSIKLIFVYLKCNKMQFTWLIKYFSFSFPLKDYFYLFSDVQMFRTIIYFGLIWFRHFLNFTAAYLMYDYYHIWSTYLHVKIFGWLIGLRASPDKLDVTTDLTLIGSICMSDAHPLFDNSYLIIFKKNAVACQKGYPAMFWYFW